MPQIENLESPEQKEKNAHSHFLRSGRSENEPELKKKVSKLKHRLINMINV